MKGILRMHVRSAFSALMILICLCGRSSGVQGKLFSQYKTELGEPADIPHAENGPELVEGAKTYQFEKDGWIIRVLFVNNWAQGALYMKKQKDKDGAPELMTDAEVAWLLKHIGGSKRWKKGVQRVVGPNEGVYVDKRGMVLSKKQEAMWLGVAGEYTHQVGPGDPNLATYTSSQLSMFVWTDKRVLTVSGSRFSESLTGVGGALYTVRDVLNPPAQKKQTPGDEMRVDQARARVVKDMGEAEANAKKLFDRVAPTMGRKRGAEKAIAHLKKWGIVVDAKVAGDFIEIQYKGDMVGKISIGPDKK